MPRVGITVYDLLVSCPGDVIDMIEIIRDSAAYCILPKSNTIEPWDVDWWQCKERSRVECFFRRSKIIVASPHDTINWRFDFSALYILCVF